MMLQIDQKALCWFGLATLVCAVSAACVITYVGIGMVYGAYVGLPSHAADLDILQTKGTRAVLSALLLQPVVGFLLWIGVKRATREGYQPSLLDQIVRVGLILVVADAAAIGLLFTLGQLRVGPIVDLIRTLDRVIGAGL